MDIGLIIIATNKYDIFIQPLIDSADKFFLKNHNVKYFIFTDKDIIIESNRDIIINYTQHKEWPLITLNRYNIISNCDKLKEMDYLYYCDADMKFVDYIGDEILGDLVVTQHPGYYGKRGTPETNEKSLACVYPTEYMEYVAGGFNGGSSVEFLKMSRILSDRINIDYNNGIIAIWHDESHLNRYIIDNKPSVILSPSYCYGESMNIPFDKKIIALDKNHNKIR